MLVPHPVPPLCPPPLQFQVATVDTSLRPQDGLQKALDSQRGNSDPLPVPPLDLVKTKEARARAAAGEVTAEAPLNDAPGSREIFSSQPLAEENRAALLLRPHAPETWARQEGALGDLIVQRTEMVLSGIAQAGEIHIGHYT